MPNPVRFPNTAAPQAVSPQSPAPRPAKPDGEFEQTLKSAQTQARNGSGDAPAADSAGKQVGKKPAVGGRGGKVKGKAAKAGASARNKPAAAENAEKKAAEPPAEDARAADGSTAADASTEIEDPAGEVAREGKSTGGKPAGPGGVSRAGQGQAETPEVEQESEGEKAEKVPAGRVSRPAPPEVPQEVPAEGDGDKPADEADSGAAPAGQNAQSNVTAAQAAAVVQPQPVAADAKTASPAAESDSQNAQQGKSSDQAQAVSVKTDQGSRLLPRNVRGTDAGDADEAAAAGEGGAPETDSAKAEASFQAALNKLADHGASTEASKGLAQAAQGTPQAGEVRPAVAHAAPAAQAPSLPTEAEFAQVNHPQIITAVRSHLSGETGAMQIRLDPPELGPLQVRIEMRDGVINASFATPNDDAARLLSHSLAQLKHSLESQGISVDKLQVQQAPREQFAGGREESSQQQPQDQSFQQEQQRRQMLRRMWRQLAGGGDDLDLIA